MEFYYQRGKPLNNIFKKCNELLKFKFEFLKKVTTFLKDLWLNIEILAQCT
jgi:hypothetical protein